jgi:hypothetical protein
LQVGVFLDLRHRFAIRQAQLVFDDHRSNRLLMITHMAPFEDRLKGAT